MTVCFVSCIGLLDARSPFTTARCRAEQTFLGRTTTEKPLGVFARSVSLRPTMQCQDHQVRIAQPTRPRMMPRRQARVRDEMEDSVLPPRATPIRAPLKVR